MNNKSNSPLRKWLVLFATGIMIILVNLDATIVNLALAKIANNFSASLYQVQWIAAAYLLAAAVNFIIFGKVADIVGVKRIFLLGVCLFSVSSLIAGLSSSINTLIAARFAQGLGWASTMSLAYVITLEQFPPEQRGLAASGGVLLSGIALASGPILGALIVSHLSWRWIFLINVPLGLISFGMTYYLVSSVKAIKESKQPTIDYLGGLIYLVGFTLILYAINQIDNLLVWQVLAFCIAGLLLLVLFIRRCHYHANPIISPSILTNMSYLTILAVRMIYMMFLAALLFAMPLFLQNILALSTMKTGVTMLSMTVFIALVSPFTGKMIDRAGYKALLLWSLVGMILVIGMLILSKGESILLIILSLLIFGISTGMHFPTTIYAVNKIIERKHHGSATGIFFTSAIAGSTIGVALVSLTIRFFSKSYLLKSHLNLNSGRKLFSIANSTHSILQVKDKIVANTIFKAYWYSFHNFLLFMLALSVFALVLSILLIIKDKAITPAS